MAAGQELTIVAIIGIILLIGIVKKNAIMIIDFALDAERNEGKPPREAIYQACLLRFRPIIMTTMAAVLGALPLMIGTGAGSELRHPLGISIVGGLLLSQLLTLFTTPVIYLWFDRLALRFSGRSGEVSGTATAARCTCATNSAAPMPAAAPPPMPLYSATICGIAVIATRRPLHHAAATEEVERFTYRAPGQANSYFYGYTRLLSLREEVEAALGAKFQQRKFHDFILSQGLLPPDLLRKAVLEEFVPSQK